jgi:hypothetical protein
MRSICIDAVAEVRLSRRAGSARPWRRGTAAIELLLVILLVFLPLLMLTWTAYIMGNARLANVAQAEDNAYRQVIAGRDVSPSMLVPDITPATPSLPNRFDEAAVTVSLRPPPPARTILHTDRALFLDPGWQYAGWPDSTMGDQAALQRWFVQYVREGQSADLAESLELQPAWAP